MFGSITHSLSLYDRSYLIGLLLLVSIGVILVFASSVDFAAERYGSELFFVKKQLVFIALGISVSAFVLVIPIRYWSKYSILLLIVGLMVLAVVLVPGIGKVVNGSRRWLPLGPFSMQASELAKICFILFFASYLDKHAQKIKQNWAQFFILVAIVGAIALLLLLEPDFGSAVVISVTLGLMMFIGGVPFLRFLLITLIGVSALAYLAVSSEYRWERIIAFLDPWTHRFGDGYQLVQSLMAFGSGGFFGKGIGESVQKTLFLPESHTDFIFAVFVEEFGFVSAVGLIALVCFLIYKMLKLAHDCLLMNKRFEAYVCIGVASVIALQSFLNMGVASGLLPTKGLTFPFISYGGSSLLITFVLAALTVRIQWELANER